MIITTGMRMGLVSFLCVFFRIKVETTIGVEPTPSTSTTPAPATPTKTKPGSLPLSNGAAGAEGTSTLTRNKKRDKTPTENKPSLPSPDGAVGEVSLKGRTVLQVCSMNFRTHCNFE